MTVHGNLIAGLEVTGDHVFESSNPAVGDLAIGTFAAADEGIVAGAVQAAIDAQPAWERLGLVARGAALRRLAVVMEPAADELATVIATEVGKPIAESRAEVTRSIVTLYYVAEQGRSSHGEHYASDDPTAMVLTARRPLGAVGIITPWNFPLNLPIWKLAPALLWGNTVVWKPAEQSPLVAHHLARLLAEAELPPGVVNVVFGGADAGAAVASNRRLAAISFTGSTQVGRKLARVTATTGARFQAELGGKNPLIVLADADLEQAADLIIAGGTSFGGQKCSATSRVIVESGAAEQLCEALVARLARLRIGDPLDADTQIGPLIESAARQRALDEIDAATSTGAILLAGGQPLHPRGWFMQPALLEVDDSESPLVQRELFAPVIALQRAADVEHAVQLANDSQYGFFVGICTGQLAALTRLAPCLRFGIVRINHVTTGADPHVPFGGWRASGNGRPEQGLAARDFYTDRQVIYLR